MRIARPFCAALLAGGLCVPMAARAQVDSREGIQLQNQILELRRDMQQLQAGGGGGGSVAPAPYAGGGEASGIAPQLLERVQSLEDQVRTLRGQVEELQNASQRQQAEFSKQLSDMSFQVQQGGHGAEATAPPAASTPAAASPPAGHLSLPGQDAGREPSPAVRDARPAGPYALARSLEKQGKLQSAAVAYDDAYNANHSGVRGQESLLGLARALYGLKDNGAACGALNKLRASFPALQPRVRDEAAGLRGRAGCG